MRFIPACAGNRIASGVIFLPLTVHPRVCGEQHSIKRAATTGAGSSPRVRGTDSIHGSNKPGVRFIPACAGNSLRCMSPTRFPSVHPRVCGEQINVALVDDVTGGSSPRVRGTA